MKLKKILASALVAVAAVTSVASLTSCSKKDDNPTTDATDETEAKLQKAIDGLSLKSSYDADFTLDTTAAGGVTISWASDKTDVISFNNGNATVKRPGIGQADATVKITATAVIDGETKIKEFTVTVPAVEDNAKTVAEIKQLEIGDSVAAKGVVTGFVYAQDETDVRSGFYLTDSTGTIYVFGMNTAAEVEEGDEIYFTGTYDCYFGSPQIKNPNDLVELGTGKTADYSAAIKDKTVTDIVTSEVPSGEQSTTPTTIHGNVYDMIVYFEKVEGTGDDGGYITYRICDPVNQDNYANIYFKNSPDPGVNYEFTEEFEEYANSYCRVKFVVNGTSSSKKWRGHILEFAELTTNEELKVDLMEAATDIPTSAFVPANGLEYTLPTVNLPEGCTLSVTSDKDCVTYANSKISITRPTENTTAKITLAIKNGETVIVEYSTTIDLSIDAINITDDVTIENGYINIPYNAIVGDGKYVINVATDKKIYIEWTGYLDQSNYKEVGLTGGNAIKITAEGIKLDALISDIYGQYDNMKCYVGADNEGTAITAVKGTDKGTTYTYLFDTAANAIYFENDSTHTVSFYDIQLVTEGSYVEPEEPEVPQNPVEDGVVTILPSMLPTAYPATTDTITSGNFVWEFAKVANYGNGIQLQAQNGTIYNTTALTGKITKIELVWASAKSVYDNTDAVKIQLGTDTSYSANTVYLSTVKDQKSYSLDITGEYTYIKLSNNITFAQYWDSIKIYYDGEAPEEPGTPDTPVTPEEPETPEVPATPTDITSKVEIDNGIVSIPYNAITANGKYTITLETGKVITIEWNGFEDKSSYKEIGISGGNAIKITTEGVKLDALVSDVYGTYDNMKCYVGTDNTGTAVTAATGTDSGKTYTYLFTDAAETIYFLNDSTHSVAFYDLQLIVEGTYDYLEAKKEAEALADKISESYVSAATVDLSSTVGTVNVAVQAGATTLAYADNILTITPTTTETTETLTISVTVGEKTYTTESISITSKIPSVQAGTFDKTVQHSSSTTTNMTDGNNAETVGLSSDLFTVTSIKNGQSNHIGLNKDGTMRLYAGSSNGSSLVISANTLTGYETVINKIVITFGPTVSDFAVNGTASTKDVTEYTINGSSVTIQNVAASGQVHIKSIAINYTVYEGEAPDAPVTPEEPTIEYTAIAENTTITFGTEGNYTTIEELVVSEATISTFNPNNTQFKAGSISFKVNEGATVVITGHSGYTSYKLNDGETITDTTYTYTATSDVVLTLTAVDANNYLTSISISYPVELVAIEEDTTITFGTAGNYTTIEELDVTNATIGTFNSDNSQFKAGSISFKVNEGAVVVITGYSGLTSYKLNDGETITDTTYTYTATEDIELTLTAVDANNYLVSISISYPVAVTDITSSVTIDKGIISIPHSAITADGKYAITVGTDQVIYIEWAGFVDQSNYNEIGLTGGNAIKITAEGISLDALVSDVYGSYDNMKCYASTNNTGTAITAVKGSDKGTTYTYRFDTAANAIYFENSSTYTVSFYDFELVLAGSYDYILARAEADRLASLISTSYDAEATVDLSSTVGTVTVELQDNATTLSYANNILNITPKTTETTETLTITVLVNNALYTTEVISITSMVEESMSIEFLPTMFPGSYISTELTTNIGGYTWGVKDVAVYSNGIQLKASLGTLYSKDALNGNITKIVFEWNEGKSTYDNANFLKIDLGTDNTYSGETVYLSTVAGTKSYTINVDGEYTCVRLTNMLNYVQYWDSIKVYYDGTELTDAEIAENEANRLASLIGTNYTETTTINLAAAVGTFTVELQENATTLAYADGVLTIIPTETEVTETLAISVLVNNSSFTTEAISITSQLPEVDESVIEYSHTFANGDIAMTEQGTTTATLSDIVWTVTTAGSSTPYFGGGTADKGPQFGSSSKPFSSLVLTSAPIENVSKVVINTSGASSIAATLVIKVNGVEVKSYTMTSSATDVEVILDAPVTGTVSFEYTQTSSKAIYIKYIEIISIVE